MACLSLSRLCRPTHKQAAHLGPGCTQRRRTLGGDRKGLLSQGCCSVEAAASGPGVPGETPSWVWRGLILHLCPAQAAGRSSGSVACVRSGSSAPRPRWRVPPPRRYPERYPELQPWGAQKQFHSRGCPGASRSLEGRAGPARSGCPQAWHLPEEEEAGDGHGSCSHCRFPLSVNFLLLPLHLAEAVEATEAGESELGHALGQAWGVLTRDLQGEAEEEEGQEEGRREKQARVNVPRALWGWPVTATP